MARPPAIGPRRVPTPSPPGTSPTSCAAPPPPADALTRPHRLQDRHLLRLPRRAGGRLRRRYVVGVWVGRPDNGPTPGLIGRQAAAPILFDAFERLGRDVEPIRRRRRARREHERRAAAAAPSSAQGRAEDHRRDRVGGGQDRLSARRRADRPRPQRGRARSAAGAEGARRRPAVHLVRQRRAGRRSDLRRQSAWKPDGAGFARVSVVDGKGASDAVVVRLE